MSELSKVQREIGDWCTKTFDKKRNHDKETCCFGIIHHLYKEVNELLVELKKVFRFYFPESTIEDTFSEAADCMIILLHYAHLNEFDLLDEVRKKMEVNYKRKWGEPDSSNVIEHIKEGEK